MGEVFQSQQRHRRSQSSIGLVGDGYPSLSIDTNVTHRHHEHHASMSSSGARAGMGVDTRSVSQVGCILVCLFPVGQYIFFLSPYI